MCDNWYKIYAISTLSIIIFDVLYVQDILVLGGY